MAHPAAREFETWPALSRLLAQPRATFGGSDLHLTVAAKAAALGRSLGVSVYLSIKALKELAGEGGPFFGRQTQRFSEQRLGIHFHSLSLYAVQLWLTDGGSPAAAAT